MFFLLLHLFCFLVHIYKKVHAFRQLPPSITTCWTVATAEGMKSVGFDTIAEIIDDAASLNATTGREEATEELQSDLQTIAVLEYPAVQ